PAALLAARVPMPCLNNRKFILRILCSLKKLPDTSAAPAKESLYPSKRLPPTSCTAIRRLVTTFASRGHPHDDYSLPAPAAPAPHRPAQRPQGQGNLLPPARPRRYAGSRLPLRRQTGHQPRLEQLPRFDGPP